MILSLYDWVYGIAQLGAVVLALIAGAFTFALFQMSSRFGHLRAWKPLLIALLLFVVEEIIGALRTFGVHHNEWITHVIPSFILVFMMYSLIQQILIVNGGMRE